MCTSADFQQICIYLCLIYMHFFYGTGPIKITFGTGPLILGPVHLIWDRSPDSRNSIQFIYYSCEYIFHLLHQTQEPVCMYYFL